MKPSSKKPKGWNDLLKVFCCNGEDTSSLAVAVANVLEFCTKNRISDILMPTYKGLYVLAILNKHIHVWWFNYLTCEYMNINRFGKMSLIGWIHLCH